MMSPWCTLHTLLYISDYQITSKFSENVPGWLYYLFAQKNIFLYFSEKPTSVPPYATLTMTLKMIKNIKCL